MKTKCLVLFVILIATGFSQWLETTIALPGPGDQLDALCYNSRDNKVYCLYHGGEIAVISGSSNRVNNVITGNHSRPLCYNPTNNKVYVLSNVACDSISIIDGATDVTLTTLAAGGVPLDFCYNPTNNKVYCTLRDGRVVTIDGVTDSIGAVDSLGYIYPSQLCYNPTNNKVYCTNQQPLPGLISVIGCDRDSLLMTVQVGGFPQGPCYNPVNNKVYYANAGNNSISIIDGAVDSVVATVVVGEEPRFLCYNPVNNKVYCTNTADGSVSVIKGVTDSVGAVLAVGARPIFLCYNPTNNKVYCTSGSGVSIIKGGTDKVDTTIALGLNSTDMVHNPVQNRVYVMNRDGFSISVIRDHPVAIKENEPLSHQHQPLIVTIVRKIIQLNSRESASLIDINGRRVATLVPGANDIRHLKPGIYFLRFTGEKNVRKVIVL